MKRFEGIIVKLLIIQLCCLVVAQSLILYTEISPFLTKVVQYEGVDGMEIMEHIETFDQNR
ncbi:YpfB family protein [Bacillus tianshenii]|uniref:YpfB family protein n=1 Tax=Sutcliffiella tianshenii TaxID=1463404 RepID=UPI001CD3FE51|nr:YpfB family protein [Bacillus tianshenii]MCA1320768.1 YpfB family protein [Bacillus tianshenii]